ELQVELAPVAGEVLVELAADEIEPSGDAQNASAEVLGELLETLVGTVGDAAEAAFVDGDEQVADGRLSGGGGGGDETFAVGSVAEAAVEVGGDGHACSFLRSRRTPADAAWRAASSDE